MIDAGAARVPEGLARGLAARIRDAVEAADRLASFAFEPGRDAPEPLPQLADGDELEVARDFVLRALRGACDGTNHRILLAAAVVSPEEGVPLTTLAGELGLPRMAVSERVHDLIQLGLVARDLQLDTVRISPAGAGVVELLSGLEAEVAEWLRKRRR